MHKIKPIAQWHADMICKFERSRAGATLSPIDDDEIRGNAGLDHRLTNGHKLAPLADAQLEANRLAIRQTAQFGDEIDEAARR